MKNHELHKLISTFKIIFKGKIDIFLDDDTYYSMPNINILPNPYLGCYTFNPECVTKDCQLAYTYSYNELRLIVLFVIENNLKNKTWEEILVLYKLNQEN